MTARVSPLCSSSGKLLWHPAAAASVPQTATLPSNVFCLLVCLTKMLVFQSLFLHLWKSGTDTHSQTSGEARFWITAHSAMAQINKRRILPCERSYETLLYPICKWDGACAVPLPPSPCRRARGARRTHGLSSQLPTGPSSRPKPARMARSRAVLHQLTWLSGKWKVLFTFGCNRAFMFLMRQISPYALL